MAFINKKDFSIISDYLPYNDLKPTPEDYFECDDMIAPTISLLNRKGYKTCFCCGGHPFPFIDNGVVDRELTPADLAEGGTREVYLMTPVT